MPPGEFLSAGEPADGGLWDFYRKHTGRGVKENNMDFGNVPLGFGFMLVQNEKALAAYAAMTENHKQAVLNQTHKAQSKQEMNQLISGIKNGTI